MIGGFLDRCFYGVLDNLTVGYSGIYSGILWLLAEYIWGFQPSTQVQLRGFCIVWASSGDWVLHHPGNMDAPTTLLCGFSCGKIPCFSSKKPSKTSKTFENWDIWNCQILLRLPLVLVHLPLDSHHKISAAWFWALLKKGCSTRNPTEIPLWPSDSLGLRLSNINRSKDHNISLDWIYGQS